MERQKISYESLSDKDLVLTEGGICLPGSKILIWILGKLAPGNIL